MENFAVTESDTWVDLADPSPNELRMAWSSRLDDDVREMLLAPAAAEEPDQVGIDGLPRPHFSTRHGSVVGLFLLPIFAGDSDIIGHQEVDMVLMEHAILTVRKPPAIASTERCTTPMTVGM